MTYKAYEHKPPDMIKERVDKDYSSILRSALTSIKGVNKTDVVTMQTNFGNFATMSRATYEELNLLPGFGKVKARRVKDAFEKPFRNGPKSSTSNKGKAKELTDQSATANTAPPGSPEWDVDPELIFALEDDLTNATNRDKTVTTSAPTRTGRASGKPRLGYRLGS
ncbi:ssDNA endonuclease and repair protein rad10 [Tulasnella sp. 418]|nr:ssDNA endonuclease and repair protein rad10 [Tulasnella sp. 418]